MRGRAINGWWRLGFVITAPFSLMAGLMGWESDTMGYLVVPAPSGLQELTDPQKINHIWAVNAGDGELRGCDKQTRRVEATIPDNSEFRLTCKIGNARRLERAIQFALIPVAFLGLVGLAAQWVYRGFKPVPTP